MQLKKKSLKGFSYSGEGFVRIFSFFYYIDEVFFDCLSSIYVLFPIFVS